MVRKTDWVCRTVNNTILHLYSPPLIGFVDVVQKILQIRKKFYQLMLFDDVKLTQVCTTKLCDEFFKQEMSTDVLKELKGLETEAHFTAFANDLQAKYDQHRQVLYQRYPK